MRVFTVTQLRANRLNDAMPAHPGHDKTERVREGLIRPVLHRAFGMLGTLRAAR
jgi:hypothetical protein